MKKEEYKQKLNIKLKSLRQWKLQKANAIRQTIFNPFQKARKEEAINMVEKIENDIWKLKMRYKNQFSEELVA